MDLNYKNGEKSGGRGWFMQNIFNLKHFTLKIRKDNMGAVAFKFDFLDKTTPVNVMCFQIGDLEVKLKLKTWRNTSILLLFQTAAEQHLKSILSWHYSGHIREEGKKQREDNKVIYAQQFK